MTVYFVEDDWELAHQKLAGIHVHDEGRHEAQFDEWLRKKGLGLQQDDPKSTLSRDVKTANEEDFEDELDREEVCLFIVYTTYM